jgi:hypothetical protein
VSELQHPSTLSEVAQHLLAQVCSEVPSIHDGTPDLITFSLSAQSGQDKVELCVACAGSASMVVSMTFLLQLQAQLASS